MPNVGYFLTPFLLASPVEVDLHVSPETDTRWANAGEATEFHCALEGRENGNQLIHWSFIPEGSTEETHLHNDVSVDRPSVTPGTSFLAILNVQKYHEGQYVCRGLNLTAIATLKVLTRSKRIA